MENRTAVYREEEEKRKKKLENKQIYIFFILKGSWERKNPFIY